jgi:hypothetical protein
VSKAGEAAGKQPRVLTGRRRVLAIVVVQDFLYPSDICTELDQGRQVDLNVEDFGNIKVNCKANNPSRSLMGGVGHQPAQANLHTRLTLDSPSKLLPGRGETTYSASLSGPP